MATALVLAATTVTNAQSFSEGDNVIGAGVGLLGGYSVGWRSSVCHKARPSTCTSITAWGILAPGLGGYVGYKTVKYESNYIYYNYDYKYTYWWALGGPTMTGTAMAVRCHAGLSCRVLHGQY